MIIQGWLNPETAAHQFIAAFPGFREAVEAAATRTAEQLDGSVATKKRQRQAFADFFRFYLVDELTFRGILACDGDEKDTVEIRAAPQRTLPEVPLCPHSLPALQGRQGPWRLLTQTRPRVHPAPLPRRVKELDPPALMGDHR
ncbi:hypothetical protein GCM10018952_44190 [Streptosporangium vulgare]